MTCYLWRAQSILWIHLILGMCPGKWWRIKCEKDDNCKYKNISTYDKPYTFDTRMVNDPTLQVKELVSGRNLIPIGSMYGIYANIGGILMVNVTIYGIHGSYGIWLQQLNAKNVIGTAPCANGSGMIPVGWLKLAHPWLLLLGCASHFAHMAGNCRHVGLTYDAHTHIYIYT